VALKVVHGSVAVFFVFIAALFSPQASRAGASPDHPPAYTLNRADEDYRSLRDPANRSDLWDPLKYLPFTESGSLYLSLGGEARERYEYFNHPAWGKDPQDHGYLLQRYFLHGDLHLGEHVRLFSQFQSSLENGRRGGPRPTDLNELDVHQLFLDLKLPLSKDSSLTLRTGRQELSYGSQRIIAVREGPNVRQGFDGFRVMLRTGKLSVDGFAAKPAETNRRIFDDGPDNARALWGTYAVLPFPLLPQGNIDLYYLGLSRRGAAFNQGSAHETRHSVGTRIWRTAAPLDYNFEFLYQWGSFGRGDISAWTAASDTGYTFAGLPLRPRVGLRADIASGDEDPSNPDLQTFNPLFPKGAYFSEAGLIGPANFIDLNPCLDLHLTDRITLIFDTDFFWRENTRDGLYNNAMALVRTGKTSNARYIGSMPQEQLFWEIDRHLTFAAIYGHFFAGRFLRESGPGEDVDYVTTWLSYKF
jgi:hypothetical protein